MKHKVLLIIFIVCSPSSLSMQSVPHPRLDEGEAMHQEHSIRSDGLSQIFEAYIESSNNDAFIELWENNCKHTSINLQLQERLLWRAFIYKNLTLFEYLIEKTSPICSQPSDYPLIYPLLTTSDKRIGVFLDALLSQYNKPYGFENSLSIIYSEPNIGGFVHLNTRRSVLSNVLYYHYNLKWGSSIQQKRAENEWKVLLNQYPIVNHFLNGKLIALPTTCSNEELVFIIDNLFLPLDKLHCLFININGNRIITEDGKTIEQYAECTNNWLFVKLFRYIKSRDSRD